ncbi:GIY-YIG nuclease family protein [Streptomyces sp.]|uniref:GIY-YIG nuclease family protein n=1 Tax=Streptomyces sp. TaxID=1931 RepID=UPI002F942620
MQKHRARRPYKGMPTPGATCLYRLYDKDRGLLYVGIANNPVNRLNAHRWDKGKPWRHDIAIQSVEWFETRVAAEDAEVAAIRSELPLHNRTHHPECDSEPWSGYSAA